MYGCLGPKTDQLSHTASGGVLLHLCFVLILSFEKKHSFTGSCKIQRPGRSHEPPSPASSSHNPLCNCRHHPDQETDIGKSAEVILTSPDEHVRVRARGSPCNFTPGSLAVVPRRDQSHNCSITRLSVLPPIATPTCPPQSLPAHSHQSVPRLHHFALSGMLYK